MKPVAAYVRMSTDGQTFSIENQLAAIDTFCAANEMVLVRTYSDAGRSGRSIINRPGLQALIHDAEAGCLPFANVLVFDVSRWGRFADADEGAYYEHVLRLAGAPVLYCNESFENDDTPVALLVKSVKRAMAAEFSRELGARVRRARRRLAAKGARVCGRPGYGYRDAAFDAEGTAVEMPAEGGWRWATAGRRTLVLGPQGEVDAVRRIYELRLTQRMPITRILARMVTEGRPPPARGWSRTAIYSILGNERVAGVAVYGVWNRRTGEPSVRHPAGEVVRVVGAWPAIVTLDEVHAAQRTKSDLAGHRSRRRTLAALRRLFSREGTITWRLIAEDPDLPTHGGFWKMFGSIETARAAAGLPSQGQAEKRAIITARAAQQMGPEPPGR